MNQLLKNSILILSLSIFQIGFGQEKFDNNPYYELNEVDTFQNFEISFMKELMLKYPTIRFEFTQYINPKETTKTARKRMNSFKQQLKDADVDLQRINFNPKVGYVQESYVNYPKSRIAGVVVSH